MKKYTGLMIITIFLLFFFFMLGLGLHLEIETDVPALGTSMVYWSIILFVLIIINHLWPRKKFGSK